MSRIFLTCPFCDSNLDPGEKCDCRDNKRNKEERLGAMLLCDKSGQITMKVEDFIYAGN